MRHAPTGGHTLIKGCGLVGGVVEAWPLSTVLVRCGVGVVDGVAVFGPIGVVGGPVAVTNVISFAQLFALVAIASGDTQIVRDVPDQVLAKEDAAVFDMEVDHGDVGVFLLVFVPAREGVDPQTISLVFSERERTLDAHIMENGTAFQSDAGMCGDYDSVIGGEKQGWVARFKNKMPTGRIHASSGEATLCGIFVEINDKSGLANKIEPIIIGPILINRIPKGYKN